MNRADTFQYEIEKQLRENGEKLSEEDKATVQSEIDAFKKVREGGDAAAIKTAMDQATQKIYEIFGKLYQGQEGQGNPGEGYTQEGPQTNPDGSVDVEGDVH